MRLQKKARKSGRADDLQKALQDVSEKKSVLEETEKKAVREALIEERSRYCLFVTFLKPVVVSTSGYWLFYCSRVEFLMFVETIFFSSLG